MNNILADLIQILQLHSDLDVSRYDDAFLMQCLNRRREQTQMQDLPSYISDLAQNESERTAFILTLNNSHTDFSGQAWYLPSLSNIFCREWSIIYNPGKSSESGQPVVHQGKSLTRWRFSWKTLQQVNVNQSVIASLQRISQQPHSRLPGGVCTAKTPSKTCVLKI